MDTGAGADTQGGVKFDLGTSDLGLPEECGCGNQAWSYIWIANSPQSTVSKINTRTMVEEGRYSTRPDGAGNPSRTSVSIDGRAVAVANRHTGLTKIWAREEFCDPMRNGKPGIQTSTGPGDVRDFHDDDCIAWHSPFSDNDDSVQRPVAWTSGVLDEETCQYQEQKVWTVTGAQGTPGQCGYDGVYVHHICNGLPVIATTTPCALLNARCE